MSSHCHMTEGKGACTPSLATHRLPGPSCLHMIWVRTLLLVQTSKQGKSCALALTTLASLLLTDEFRFRVLPVDLSFRGEKRIQLHQGRPSGSNLRDG